MNIKGFLLGLSLSAFVFSGCAMARGSSDPLRDDTPSAEAIVFDLAVARPIGLVGTIAGAGIFVLTLPFSIFIGDAPLNPAKRLVVEPFKYTFFRPLGESTLSH